MGAHVHQHRCCGSRLDPLFTPPTNADPWQLVDGSTGQENILGKIFAPFANKTVQYNGGTAASPGPSASPASSSTATGSSRRTRSCGSTAAARSSSSTAISRRPGDFFPALQQLAGTTWQQIAAGGPDAYKVDCVKIERLWRDWFSALYESAMEQGYGDYLLPYLARKVHGEWRLGANASGIYRPAAPNGKYVPLVTPGTFKDGVLATPKTRPMLVHG
jgi:hypothetical protein